MWVYLFFTIRKQILFWEYSCLFLAAVCYPLQANNLFYFLSTTVYFVILSAFHHKQITCVIYFADPFYLAAVSAFYYNCIFWQFIWWFFLLSKNSHLCHTEFLIFGYSIFLQVALNICFNICGLIIVRRVKTHFRTKCKSAKITLSKYFLNISSEDEASRGLCLSFFVDSRPQLC